MRRLWAPGDPGVAEGEGPKRRFVRRRVRSRIVPETTPDSAEAAAPEVEREIARRWRFHHRLSHYDRAVLLFVHRFQGPRMTLVMRAFTRAGDAHGWLLIGGTLVFAGGRRGRRLAARMTTAITLAGAVSQVVKRLSNRRRPSHAIPGFLTLVRNPDEFSFPSGHTSVAFGAATALADSTRGLGPLSLALAAGIGLSRIYLGAHFPLDVAAGVCVGVASGTVARALVP